MSVEQLHTTEQEAIEQKPQEGTYQDAVGRPKLWFHEHPYNAAYVTQDTVRGLFFKIKNKRADGEQKKAHALGQETTDGNFDETELREEGEKIEEKTKVVFSSLNKVESHLLKLTGSQALLGGEVKQLFTVSAETGQTILKHDKLLLAGSEDSPLSDRGNDKFLNYFVLPAAAASELKAVIRSAGAECAVVSESENAFVAKLGEVQVVFLHAKELTTTVELPQAANDQEKGAKEKKEAA